VQGSGYVDSVQLRVATDGAPAVTALRGQFNLLSMTGPRRGPLTVTLARVSDAGLQVVGGELVRGRSAGVTVILQPVTHDAVAQDPGRPDPVTPDAAGLARKIPASPATWATAAAASAAAKGRDQDDHGDDPTPEAGDRVEHFAFGLCEVLTSDGDRLRIRDVEGPHRVREVSLAMLRVTGPTESEGKRLFQLVRRVPA
jgi:hypothetical protein